MVPDLVSVGVVPVVVRVQVFQRRRVLVKCRRCRVVVVEVSLTSSCDPVNLRIFVFFGKQLCRGAGPFLLTSSFDTNVRAWTTAGGYLGTLCHDKIRNRNPQWDVPFDTGRMAAEAEEATRLLEQQVKAARFTPLHTAEELDAVVEPSPLDPTAKRPGGA